MLDSAFRINKVVDRLRLFKKLRRKIDYLERTQIEEIHRAYLTALHAHRGQRRQTGEPYISHPVAVACILADMHMDYQSIIAALLHDVIEDTHVSKDMLAKQYGDVIADLVDGVSKLTQIEFVSKAEAQAENFRKMVLAMAKDIRVILIKLADRLHNMRTLGSLSVMKRRRIAKETLEIYAPVAKRLGMREFSDELEELGFMALYPMRYHILKEAVQRARGNRKKILNLIEKTLHDGVVNGGYPSCSVKGREKHLYSIYCKMRKKNISFNEIMDVYAFRMVVDSVDTCYRMLGLAHSVYKPVPERFKDYIAIPKINGYQSLHTTLFGPYGLPIEMQIRTTEMDKMANSGIAAHWLYKSEEGLACSRTQVRVQQWMKNLLELQQRSGNSLEFIENVKVDLFPDEVYVFTPKGDIKEMPAGVTAVDFAYMVHTDIGNNCVAVKINNRLSPLSTKLTNGQTIEVITTPRGRPNPAWLDFVVTSKAKSSIRHFMKTQRRSESIELGAQLLEKSLKSLGLSLKKVSSSYLDHVVGEYDQKSWNDVLEAIGLGLRPALLVAYRISELSKIKLRDNEPMEITNSDSSLLIKGSEGMVVRFASCCNPIPGDPILGVLEVGRGLMVHHDKCPVIGKLQHKSNTVIALRWSKDVSQEFRVNIGVQMINQRGVLAVLALAVSDAGGNVEDIRVDDREGTIYDVDLTLLVNNRVHLAKIMRKLRHISAIIKIARIK